MTKKRVLFLSVVNLATDPRVLKEIRLALSLGYEVTFMGFTLGNWSDEKERLIRAEIPEVTCIYMDATRKNYLRWLSDTLKGLFYQKIWPFFRNNIYITAGAHSKRSIALMRAIKTVRKGQYDLIIGHTLGALYPMVRMARRVGCVYAFDVEDYHPGEQTERDIMNETARREILMQKFLPGAAYVSAASNLIAVYTTRLCNGLAVCPVLNFFPAREFICPEERGGGPVRIVWFSQNITFGRGLEIILSAWPELGEKCELTLIGNIDPVFKADHLHPLNTRVRVLPPLDQPTLHRSLAGYDIGLALEVSSVDLNKDLALSNKILAYYQAGLYIVATDTSAQVDFLNRHPAHGRLVRQDAESLLGLIKDIVSYISYIRQEAVRRAENAKDQSWENESKQLEILWRNAILQ